MERKIGEVFEYNGEWYQTIKSQGKCCSCDFMIDGHCIVDFSSNGSCFYCHRKDKENVIFKKLEKVGEPMKIHNRLVLKVKADAYNCMRCCFYSKAKCELTIQECERYDCGEGTKFIEINKEDMEEKNNAKHSNFEKIEKNLKEFNLEAAKSGKPVCTRDGRKARIICFDRKLFFKKISYPILALVERPDGEDDVCAYNEKGKVLIEDDEEYKDDLRMLPEKKEGWVNVYKGSVYISVYPRIYKSREEAVSDNTTVNRIDTVKIYWEE